MFSFEIFRSMAYTEKINSMSWCTMCSLVTYTVQLNPSLHVYFISDKIVLKCAKTHDSRIPMNHFVMHFKIVRLLSVQVKRV